MVGRQRRAEAAKAETPGAVLDVYRGGDGRWGWVYRETEGDFELCSNRTFATKEEAAESARLAYPDVPFDDAQRD